MRDVTFALNILIQITVGPALGNRLICDPTSEENKPRTKTNTHKKNRRTSTGRQGLGILEWNKVRHRRKKMWRLYCLGEGRRQDTGETHQAETGDHENRRRGTAGRGGWEQSVTIKGFAVHKTWWYQDDLNKRSQWKTLNWPEPQTSSNSWYTTICICKHVFLFPPTIKKNVHVNTTWQHVTIETWIWYLNLDQPLLVREGWVSFREIISLYFNVQMMTN